MTTVNEIGAHKMFVVISFLIAVNLFIEAVSELSYGLVSKLFWRVHPIKIKNYPAPGKIKLCAATRRIKNRLGPEARPVSDLFQYVIKKANFERSVHPL